jgi:hypothetical protein
LDSVRTALPAGRPIRIEIVERCLDGEFKGWLRTGGHPFFRFLMIVEMAIHNGERGVVERPWHRGDTPLEHVANITNSPPMVLPP